MIREIFILIVPALFATTIYMILARIIRAVNAEALSLVPIQWLTKIFVIGDVLAFTLQAGGGGVQGAGTLDLYELGEKIIIVGLFVQIGIFGFFVVTTVVFHIRLINRPTPAALHAWVPWRRHLAVLYTTSGLILIRSVFRVIEYLQGNSGYIISHEVYLYVFDACLMVFTMAIFCAWYVGDLDRTSNHKSVDSTDTANLVMDTRIHKSRPWKELRMMELAIIVRI